MRTAWQVVALNIVATCGSTNPGWDDMPLPVKRCMPTEAFSRDLVIAPRSPNASRALHTSSHRTGQVCLCIITTVLVAACENHNAGQSLTYRVPISIRPEWSNVRQ